MPSYSTIRGVSYTLPVTGEIGWANQVTGYLAAIPAATQTLLTFGSMGGAGGAGVQTVYLRPVMADAVAAVGEVSFAVPVAGVVRNMYVLENVPHTGNNAVYTLRKNAVDTALVVTLASTVGSGHNTTNSVSVIAGDLLSLKLRTDTTSVDPTGIVVCLTLSME